MCLWASYKKKYEFFFVFFKINEEINLSDPEPEPDPDPFVRGTDPGIRIWIRTKMSRIPNTVLKIFLVWWLFGLFVEFFLNPAGGCNLSVGHIIYNF
jgi:hypothetical protein